MPVHDWTRVEAGIYHNFHLSWISELCKSLNNGLLPEGYYGLAEQHAGRAIPDVLTLHVSPPSAEPMPVGTGGGTAVAEAPPKTRVHQRIEKGLLARRRSIAIRHVSGHRLIALVEIISPGNKDGQKQLREFTGKVADALNAGIHVLLVDLFPPGRHDPRGLHAAILELLDSSDQAYDLPPSEPLTLASYMAYRYAAEIGVDAYLEHLAPGAPLAEMPLFLEPDRYILAPLESTYLSAYRGMPAFWRGVLEGAGN